MDFQSSLNNCSHFFHVILTTTLWGGLGRDFDEPQVSQQASMAWVGTWNQVPEILVKDSKFLCFLSMRKYEPYIPSCVHLNSPDLSVWELPVHCWSTGVVPFSSSTLPFPSFLICLWWKEYLIGMPFIWRIMGRDLLAMKMAGGVWEGKLFSGLQIPSSHNEPCQFQFAVCSKRLIFPERKGWIRLQYTLHFTSCQVEWLQDLVKAPSSAVKKGFFLQRWRGKDPQLF